MEPNAEFSGELEAVQRVAVGAEVLVYGLVPCTANGAEQLVDLGRQRTGVPQALEEVNLLLLGQLVQPEVGGCVLSKHLGELPQLDDRRGRVVGEVPLRERTK